MEEDVPRKFVRMNPLVPRVLVFFVKFGDSAGLFVTVAMPLTQGVEQSVMFRVPLELPGSPMAFVNCDVCKGLVVKHRSGAKASKISNCLSANIAQSSWPFSP